MIYINEKTRIKKLDDKNLVIETFNLINKKSNGIKTGETTERWEWQGYYGDLRTALIGVLKKELFNTAEEETTIQELIKKIDEIESKFKISLGKLRYEED